MPRAATSITLLLAALVAAAPGARADEVTICYNYGCHAQAQVAFAEPQLDALRSLFAGVEDPAAERAAISVAIGRMYAIAGEQSPVWRDKGGNYADGGENGRMDCIDHSTNTDAFLRLLQAHAWLRFHEVLAPLKRMRFLVFEHWGARIVERGTQQIYVVDSWYFDNGHAAAVFAIEEWLAGKLPDGA